MPRNETSVPEPSRYPDRGNDTSGSSDSESTRGTSIWTKVLIVVLGLLVVIALVAHLVVGGGPRH
jgi:hypothetical protein